jgi:hypothetical protein
MNIPPGTTTRFDVGKPEIFLVNLQQHLDNRISCSEAAKYPLEGPFPKEKIVPALHSFLLSLDYGGDEAQEALLAEGCRDPLIKQLVSGTPSPS